MIPEDKRYFVESKIEGHEMLKEDVIIHFYYPRKDWTNHPLPEREEDFMPWLSKLRKNPSVDRGRYTTGRYAWTILTYLILKKDIPCKLVEKIPDSGIVLCHADYLETTIKPSKRLFIVCLKAEKKVYPYAQLYLVQDPEDEILKRGKRFPRYWKAYFMEHWPQPGLKPRIASRDRFENIAFIGNPGQLDQCFRTEKFKRDVSKMGLNFKIVDSLEKWNDFREIDCILAVRDLSSKMVTRRPATKLFNAWLAGVPAILGPEAGFRKKRESHLDYIEARNYLEVIEAIKMLKNNPFLRKKMIENGLERGKDYTFEKTLNRWKYFINNVVIPDYKQWLNFPGNKVDEFIELRERYNVTKDINVFKCLPLRLIGRLRKKLRG